MTGGRRSHAFVLILHMEGTAMCGIAGWIDFRENLRGNNAVLESMLGTLSRRGPDASGIYTSETACILHRRLIVVDPDNGLQPMHKCIGGTEYILTYNGELYNTEDIRRELLKIGYTFTGYSDTEVLLTAYIEWGSDCVDHLNGIFAFAVWNVQAQSLFMARDRLGVKPLFFYKYSEGLLFGSEIKTLLANPLVRPDLDQDGLNQIFLLGPGRRGGSGVIRNIKELRPSECMEFDKQHFAVRQYWRPRAFPHTDSLSQTLEKTRFLLTDAVQRQLVSDVPLCCFLSGGLDSSLISAIAAEEYRKDGRTLSTYSVDYTDNARFFQKSNFQPNADSEFIGIMTDFLGSEHQNIVLSNQDTADALTEAAWARDLPGMADIDSSLLLFCREIKRDFTVAVSGECADEIFGGYPWYHNKTILFEDTFPWSRSVTLRKSLLKDGVLQDGSEEYVHACYQETVQRAEKLPDDSALDSRMREMFMLNFEWFMQTLLDRKDRMSMFSGLEVRVPFCDHRIVEYAYNMPWSLKALHGREKGIIREAVKDLLPNEIVWRKKSPYPKTHNPVYLQLVREHALDILKNRNNLISELVDYQLLENLEGRTDLLADPWYGQLMKLPQIYAYLIQVDAWMNRYRINLV